MSRVLWLEVRNVETQVGKRCALHLDDVPESWQLVASTLQLDGPQRKEVVENRYDTLVQDVKVAILWRALQEVDPNFKAGRR